MSQHANRSGKHGIARLMESVGLDFARVDHNELMDDPGQDTQLLRENLAELERVNRLLSGNAMTIRCIRDFVVLGRAGDPTPRALSMLDICCGGGDMARKVAAWLRHKGISPRMVAADMSPTIVELARERGKAAGDDTVEYAVADARDLPYPDAEFDLVNVSLALHHFPPAEAEKALAEMRRVASRGVIVTDLSRTWTCLALSHIMARTIIPGYLSRHDGPLSVKRSYLPLEAEQLALRAGFSKVRVRSVLNSRYSLSCWV